MKRSHSLVAARFHAMEKRARVIDILSGAPYSGQPPEQPGMIERASTLIRRHPLSASAAGMALGFVLASYHESLIKEIEIGLKEISSKISSRASAVAQNALSSSLSGIASQIVRQLLSHIY